MPDASQSVVLSRAVRFSLPLKDDAGGPQVPHSGHVRHNAFAGHPSLPGLGVYAEWIVSVIGTPDARTGYLLNISEIDRAVVEGVTPILGAALRSRSASVASILRGGVAALQAAMNALGTRLHEVRWRLTPYYSLAMAAQDLLRVRIAQSFEFAAAHRLHCADLDEATNRAIFGKCNNPNGHGHNYRVEVEVAVPFALLDQGKFSLRDLEAIVARHVIARLDHKHLNLDVPEFARINPSVENITRLCHDLLCQPLQQAGVDLARITVWETEKTACTYPA